ncbi:AhpC/TSA family protein [Rubritalea squalenifaciens DSM 18772]|uniref:AhpC/TSA family protein n=1 Tax=Rubritalea squalenifaciens DSM 18772 TaxID=1123071 RepID=A0A1M6IN20_9BACT|nr:TlpA disulfide reductase family protein [Rubritalea squalenifaciens]SHJ35753.1 AhpC/TSA family protein [Rubritalea squalenifaciens DSM 18772]
MKLKKNATIACLAMGMASLNTLAYAQAEAPAEAPAEEAAEAKQSLKVGDKAPAFEGVEWLKGGPIEKLDEKGKVYLIECWATWCGPCIQVIPHVNDLHKKYGSKGLVVIGVDVFEESSDAAKAFVEKQGDKMSYPVAYWGGEDAAFSKNWLNAAGVEGIPHSFIVKDGVIQLMTHPAGIDEKLIESLLDGSFDAAKYAAEQEAEQKAEEEFRAKLMPLMQAGEWDKVIEFAKTLKEDDTRKPQIIIAALTNKKDWKALLEFRKETAAEKYKDFTTEYVDTAAMLQLEAGEGSEEYAKTALETFKATPEDSDQLKRTEDGVLRSRLRFLAGDKEAAVKELEELKGALDKIEDENAKAQFGKLIDKALAKIKDDSSFPPVYSLFNE